jgi:YD repeat-containing protein
MVAVISTQNFGLGNAFGGNLLGSAATGANGESLYVNSRNGNLSIQRRDQLLTGRGHDLGVLRTYNSQGLVDDDNGDGFVNGAWSRLKDFIAGVSVVLVKSDGSEETYTLKTGTTTTYERMNADGLVDTLKADTTAGLAWTWTSGHGQGADRVTETFSWAAGQPFGRIAERKDAYGSRQVFSYDTTTGMLSQIDMPNGDYVKFSYSGTAGAYLLDKVQVFVPSESTTTAKEETLYFYDTSNRLQIVQTNWTDNASVVHQYKVKYSYEEGSKRISRMEELSGTGENEALFTSMSFTYEADGAVFRVKTVTDDKLQRTTSFDYLAGGVTRVTDALGAITELTHDSAGRLLRVDTPSVGGVVQRTLYTYDTLGRLTTIKDALDRVTTYEYPTPTASLRIIKQTDPTGLVITRRYRVATDASNNQLLAETVDSIANNASSIKRTTRFVYGAQNTSTAGLLRFVISPAGRVTEYIYDGYGQRVSELHYGKELYATVGDTSDPTESQLETEQELKDWLDHATYNRRNDKVTLTSHTYDFRGNLSSSTTYSETAYNNSVAGAPRTDGVTGAPLRKTVYNYDFAGRLLSEREYHRTSSADNTSEVDSATHDNIAIVAFTSYSYDELGRVRSMVRNTAAGGAQQTTTMHYADSGNTVTTVTGAMVTVETFDAAGERTSVSERGVTGPSKQYRYDALGRLRQEIDATGIETMYLYDSAGRMVARIAQDGTITQMIYNKANQLAKTVSYAGKLDADQLRNLKRTPVVGPMPLFANVDDLSSFLPPPDTANDRTAWTLYDKAGRVAKSIDPLGYMTQYFYDNLGNKVATLQFETTSTPPASVDTFAEDFVAPTRTNLTRLQRWVYNKDGMLIAEIDSEGYMTEYLRNQLGQISQMVRYDAKISDPTAATSVYVGLSNGRPNLTGTGASNTNQNTYYYYDAAGRVRAEVRHLKSYDASPVDLHYLTEHVYNGAGDLLETRVFGNAIIGSNFVYGDNLAAQLADANAVNTASSIQTTRYEYNRDGSLLAQVAPDGARIEYAYDQFGRVVAVSTGVGVDERRTSREFDAFGRLVKEYDALNSTSKARFTSYTYDAAGRLASKTDADDKTVRYFYDSNNQLTHTINELGDVLEHQYNAFGQVSGTIAHGQKLDPLLVEALEGGVANTTLRNAIQALFSRRSDGVIDYHQTSYTYTKRGQLYTMGDNNGGLTTNSYTAFGELSGQVGNDAPAVSYLYDRRGLRTSTSIGSGSTIRTTRTAYDAYGRAEKYFDERNSSTTATTTTTYDRWNRVVSVTGPFGTTKTYYDAFNRVTRSSDNFNNETTYAYDLADRKVTVTSPGGVVMTTRRNVHGEDWEVTYANNANTKQTYA